MYRIHEKKVIINEEVVPVFSREIQCGNTRMTVSAGSNGLNGGDRDAGSRSYFMLSTDGDAYVKLIKDKDTDKPIGFLFAGCGDEILKALTKATAFLEKAFFDAELGLDREETNAEEEC